MADLKQIKIETGNLLSSDDFKRKVILVPSAELLEGLKLTLEEWKRTGVPDITEHGLEKAVIESQVLKYQTDVQSRNGLKVSVKIFTYSESCSVFTDALQMMMKSLGIETIDSLTLSLPPSRSKGSIEEVKSIWACAVKNVAAGRIKDLGVSDLNAEQLKELYAWADEVKPTTNQVNLDACCVIPSELNDFAKDKHIRLLTHNDPRDILPRETLVSLLKESGFPNPDGWCLLWVSRYSVLVTGSGVIESKGYIVSLIRV